MYWTRLTTTDFDSIDRNTPVLMNVASIEQHGPGLPVVTDSAIGWHFCQSIEAMLGDGVLVAPQVRVCCSEHHMRFAGTLTVTHQTFLNYLIDLLTSVYRHGFKNIFILNSHGGNIAVGNTAKEHLGNAFDDLNIAFANWWQIAVGETKKISNTGFQGTAHAGEFETSLMLFIKEALVKKDFDFSSARVKDTPEWAAFDIFKGPEIALHRRFDELTENGIYGRPEAGTAEKGKKISEIISQRLAEIIREFGELQR